MSLSDSAASASPADLIQPFDLEVPGLRGRLLRMGPLVQTVLSHHDYPEPVAKLLGEALALVGVLSSMLKFDGIFTLQTKGDGPVGMLVADMTAAGELRGYADFDASRLDALVAAGAEAPTGRALMGNGYIAFTVDQGTHTERYQGIVELTGDSLEDCVQHYFRQSEQLKTAVKLSAARVDGAWRAGGLLLQQFPEEEAPEAAYAPEPATDQEDHWRRSVVLMASCSDQELLDPGLPANDLLYRLFHQEQVRVYEPRPLVKGCRCSRARLAGILGSLPRNEVAEMKVEGEVVMTCQFCNIDFRFDDTALEKIYTS